MTEKASRLDNGSLDAQPHSALVENSLTPGRSISLSFHDGVVHVTLDQMGDWTITAGLSVRSDRLVRLTRAFQELGFFQATEQSGMVYHLWTSALGDNLDSRSIAEQTLIRLVDYFQETFTPSYIN